MGAETSTLQSIDSLSSTLQDIEKKLTNIESLHFRHERTIALDNTIMIADKPIICRQEVKIITGPVIGLIGHNFFRILVETNVNSTVSINVFSVNSSGQASFVSEQV